MSRRTLAWVLTAILAVGLFMRVAWLRADPPVADAVGIVWHDEGAWVHNARNRALWGPAIGKGKVKLCWTIDNARWKQALYAALR